MLVNLFISYPLLLAPIVIGIQDGKASLKVGSCRHCLMRIAVVVLTVAISLVGHVQFRLVFKFFASVCVPVQGLLVPIVFGRKIRERVGAGDVGTTRRVVHAMISALALLGMAIGLHNSVADRFWSI
jgi:hypothetical protein